MDIDRIFQLLDSKEPERILKARFAAVEKLSRKRVEISEIKAS